MLRLKFFSFDQLCNFWPCFELFRFVLGVYIHQQDGKKACEMFPVTGKIFLRWRHFMHDWLFDSSLTNHKLSYISKYISVTYALDSVHEKIDV